MKYFNLNLNSAKNIFHTIFLTPLGKEKADSSGNKAAFITSILLFAIFGILFHLILRFLVLPEFILNTYFLVTIIAILITAYISGRYGKYNLATALALIAFLSAIIFMTVYSSKSAYFFFIFTLPIIISYVMFPRWLSFALSIFFVSTSLIITAVSDNISIQDAVMPIGFIFIVTLVMHVIHNFRNKENQVNQDLVIQTRDVTIYALAYQAELRDRQMGKHLERTSRYVRVLAESLCSSDDYNSYITGNYLEDLARASVLHDIGKVGVPDSILLKPGKLDEKEFEEIKKHCEYGAMVLFKAQEKLTFQSFFDIAIQIVLYHHEKWDGSGYPNKLKGEDIPLSARIMALADVYDAVRSNRVYKNSIPHDKCYDIIISGKGSHFDPKLVDCFIENEKNFLRISEELKD